MRMLFDGEVHVDSFSYALGYCAVVFKKGQTSVNARFVFVIHFQVYLDVYAVNSCFSGLIPEQICFDSGFEVFDGYSCFF